MEQEYETGRTIGTITGVRDANLLVPPTLQVNGTETYQDGFRRGYLLGYVQGLANKLRSGVNNEIQQVIANRLDEVSNCINLDEPKQKQK